jgi:Mg2+ and Co2+ transporter CorA
MEAIIISSVLGLATLIVLVLVLRKLTVFARLTAELSEKIPGTAMTAQELAEELGESIDQAFRAYVPQPSELAEALADAVGEAGKRQAEQAEALGQVLQGVGTQWKEELAAVLEAHVSSLTSANDALAAELKQISTLEQDLVNLLHVQESVEGALKQLTVSDEFKNTLDALRVHLDASDQLLREVAKPRTIRLVESDDEGYTYDQEGTVPQEVEREEIPAPPRIEMI